MDGPLKRELVPIVRETFGNALRSVLLYGSGAGGQFVRGVSDLNVLVIVEYLDGAALERFGRRGGRVLRRRCRAVTSTNCSALDRDSALAPSSSLSPAAPLICTAASSAACLSSVGPSLMNPSSFGSACLRSLRSRPRSAAART